MLKEAAIDYRQEHFDAGEYVINGSVNQTGYEHVELKINELPAMVECNDCGSFYEIGSGI